MFNKQYEGGDPTGGYLKPYTDDASSDFGTAHSVLGSEFSNLSQYGDPADMFYKFLQEGPEALLGQAEQGYKMSDGARNQLKFSLGAANNRASQTGMTGSGDEQALDAEIGNQIYGQDQQQYLKNLKGATGEQQSFLNEFSKQMNNLQKSFGRMMNMEYGASRQSADLTQRAADENMREGDKRRDSAGSLLGDIADVGMHLGEDLFDRSNSSNRLFRRL